jgi:hypothetical protein
MNEALDELKETINVHLDQCDGRNTPFICAQSANPESRAKIVDEIARTVIERDSTIGDTILLIESLYNPNMLD